jgi:hypothetical protein
MIRPNVINCMNNKLVQEKEKKEEDEFLNL